jgi:hypothetical protein
MKALSSGDPKLKLIIMRPIVVAALMSVGCPEVVVQAVHASRGSAAAVQRGANQYPGQPPKFLTIGAAQKRRSVRSVNAVRLLPLPAAKPTTPSSTSPPTHSSTNPTTPSSTNPTTATSTKPSTPSSTQPSSSNQVQFKNYIPGRSN